MIGRLIARGLDDELRGTAFAVVDLLSICRRESSPARHDLRLGMMGGCSGGSAGLAFGLDGVVLGRFGGQYLRHSGPVSATAA